MELVDIHSHILHDIDDGASSLDVSIELLKRSYENGVNKLVLTPHFTYHSENSVDRFIRKRERRLEQLKSEIENQGILVPELYLGAEVTMNTNLSRIDGIEKLSIAGTRYILIEMPYTPWLTWMYDCLFDLITVNKLIPVIAHIERYFLPRDNKRISDLANLDVYFQINASSVLDKKQHRNIIKLVNNNLVYFIGSDTHDLVERPPKVLEALEHLEKKVSYELSHFLNVNNNLLLQNEFIDRAEDVYIPKNNMSILDRLFNSGSL